MAARSDVVEVLNDMHPDKGPFVHQDGRPFAQAEKDLVMSATAEDLEEAARQAEAAAAEAQKGAEVHQVAARLIGSTPGATTLDEVQRIRGRDWTVLLAEESGLPLGEVREIISRGDLRP